MDGVPFPPSLQNIFKEIHDDLGTPIPMTGNLTRWAEQGVLLLNASLSVRAHQANSHSQLGWQTFTDAAIRSLATHREHIVYMLWGSYARGKAYMIDRQRNLVLESVHPSPLSANRGGWFGQHQFSRCNEYLSQNGIAPIEW
jgi:uracil-DNA glycosylase